MINTKTSSTLKLIVYIAILTGIYSCETHESFSFHKKTIAIGDIFDCENTDCALTEIFLLETISENEISKKINFQIEKAACATLNIDENIAVNSMEKAIESFNTSYLAIKKEFPDEIIPYEASINCELNFQNKSILSIRIDSYIFTGGAHGSATSQYININPKTGEIMTITALIKDIRRFSDFVESAFRKHQEIAENASINSTGLFFENDRFALPSSIGIDNSEIILFYNPYEISSYSEGPIELKIPKDQVIDYFHLNIL